MKLVTAPPDLHHVITDQIIYSIDRYHKDSCLDLECLLLKKFTDFFFKPNLRSVREEIFVDGLRLG